MSADQILKEAMSLPPEGKARLAERLLASLSGAEQSALDSAWAEEVESRIDAYASGEATARPADEVISSIRQRLLEWR
jgi:putative addiction module component (TIGR02574 family)